MTPGEVAAVVMMATAAPASIVAAVAFIRHLTADDRHYRESLRKDRS